MHAMTGRTIGNYHIVARIGEGGMGTVYRAIDTMVEREVALKCLKPEIAAEAGVLDRFRREAVLLARLNHPAVAQLYTFFKEGSEFYMVMEYVHGETLDRVIERRGALPWPEAFALGAQILEGVGHAHSLGILHRDLKPSNIILTPAGGMKLMDFGIAQALGAARLTRDGRIVGTLEYLAPERIQGKPADARSDVYSAGVVLYEMLTGRLPFDTGSEYELIVAHVTQPVPAPRELGIDLPVAVEKTVMKALEKDPNERYPDAASFASALAVFNSKADTGDAKKAALKPTRRVTEPAAPEAVPAVPSAGMRPKAPWLRRRWIVAAGAACAALALAAAFWTWRGASRQAESAASRAMPEQPAPAAQTPTQASPAVMLPVPAPASPIPTEFIPVARPKTPAREPVAAGPATPEPSPRAGEPSPMPSAELRRSAISALDATDATAGRQPGSGPIRLSGLLAALRIGGKAIAADMLGPIASRGVEFQMTPAAEAALRDAGATPELLRLIASSYTAAKPAGAAAPDSGTVPAQRIASLANLRSVYVEDAQGGLDEAVREEIGRQLGSVLRLSGSLTGADAVMRLTVEAREGGVVSGTARVLGIKDRSVARAVLVEPGTSRVLWQRDIGDRKPIIGAVRGESVRRLAERIVRELKQDLSDRQPR